MEKNRFQVRVELPNGNNHRFSIVPSLPFNSLQTHLKEISNLSDIAITYLDDEGDNITLAAEDEFTEAKRALDIGNIVSLRIAVTAGPNAKPYKNPEPEPRPQPTPRSAPGKVGRNRKGGHYAELAEEFGESLHLSAPKQQEGMHRNTQTDADLLKYTLAEMKKVDQNAEMERSSEWRECFVAKASQEITNVLEGLIHSVANEPSSILNLTPNSGTCHIGIKCRQCNKTIIGNRYKCGNCADYDVCELCLLKHDPTHVFLLLRLPCPNAGRKVPLLSDNIYHPEGKTDEGEHIDRPGLQTYVVDKKLKKAIKMEKKMKKIFPRYVEAQVDLNTDIQHLRKQIEDMSERMKTTATTCYSPSPAEEVSLQTAPVSLTQGDYSATIVKDKEDCAIVSPSTRFSCKWLVENNGTLFWTSVRFHCVSGNLIPEERQVSLPVCSPGEQIELEVPFTAPNEEGYYYSQWRLSHHGKGFGPTLKAECRVSYQLLVADKNVEVDSGAEDDEDLASADQGFALRAFPGAGGLQQPLIAISHEDYIDESLIQANPTCDADSIDLDTTELIHQDDIVDRAASPLYSDPDSYSFEKSPLLYTQTSVLTNTDTASIASSSADSFIVVQMPDSFDPNKPIYLKQGSETVPASVLPAKSEEILHEDSPEFSSPISSPDLISITPIDPQLSTHGATSYSPQPNVNITCLSASPLSSLKSFVSLVVDKLDDSLTRSATPRQQLEMFSSTHEDFQFEAPSYTSPPGCTDPNPFLIQPTDEQAPLFPVDMFASTSSFTSSTFQLTDNTEFHFQAGPSESFLAKKEESFDEEAFPAGGKDQWLSNEFQMNPHSGTDNLAWVARDETTPPSLPHELHLTNDDEAWIAPGTNWKPKIPSTPIEQLMKMGFCNRDLNSKLLERFHGNLEQVIEALIEEPKLAWPVNNI